VNAAEAIKGFFYWLLAPVLGAIVRVLFRLRVRGWENLPQQGGFLLVARHRSYWDIPLLITVLGHRRRIYFVARKTLLHENPFLAFWVRHYAITIDREHFQVEDLRKVLEAIRSGKIVGIFPEGTTRAPQRAHPGVIRFAERTGSEFVAVRFEARGPYPHSIRSAGLKSRRTSARRSACETWSSTLGRSPIATSAIRSSLIC
jgi:1-acyl-sn-glycerol-3-phosphate acyltransferase